MTYLRNSWHLLVQGIALIGASQLGETCNKTFGDATGETVRKTGQIR